MKRTVASVVVLVAFGSFNLAEAGAATVGSGGFGTTLQFSAAPGEINDVTIARSGETYTVTDTINLISPGSGCSSASNPGSTEADHSVICHNPSFPDHLYLELLANLGDMSDSLVVTAEYGDLVVYGEAGNDTITWLPSGDLAANVRYRGSFFSGGDGDDAITASAGIDHIQGGAGADTILAGGGRDFLDGGADPDSIFGGRGHDTITGGGGDDFLNGEVGSDVIDGQANADTIIGDVGKDRLTGGYGPDVLRGGADPDTIYGLGGDDRLFGGAGFDALFGGRGFDLCRLGMGGGTKGGCET